MILNLKMVTQYILLAFLHILGEFTVSGPHNFPMDSIILQNSDHMKKP